MTDPARYTKKEEIVIESGIGFTQDMLHLSPNAPRREYYSRKKEGEIKTMVHWGQRKLFISELEFLIFFWDPQKVPHPTIVYAGAACGDHIPLLPIFFPSIDSLHLYDPAPFNIQATDKIHIYKQMFTVKEAKEWAGRTDVFFISDIRTGDYTTMSSDENELSILADMELQRQCVEIMNPVQSHLKFRLPYSDFDAKYLQLEYLEGYVLLQPWAPYTSTETRLIPIPLPNSKKYQTKTWDALEYEEQLFYHNTVNRSNQLYLNPLGIKNELTPLDPPELHNDYDSVAEAFILKSYFRKFGQSTTPKEVYDLSKWITAELNKYTKHEKSIDLLRQKSIKIQYQELRKNKRKKRTRKRRKSDKTKQVKK